jgi:hypothetical protein
MGAYSEAVYLDPKKLIPVPLALEPAQVAPLVLNYVVAYQTLHRAAKVKSRDSVLIIGASGGIGTAFLQLGRVAGLRMYGLATRSKHATLAEYGAIPIDYRREDFVSVVRQAESGGLDAVFDGIGGDYLLRGFPLLKHGGVWVSYANPRSLGGLARLLGQVIWRNLAPDGRKVALYGTGASLSRLMPFFILGLLLPVYGKQIGASVVEIGLFFSAFSLVTVLLPARLGRLADRFGRKPMMMLSLGAAAASSFVVPALGGIVGGPTGCMSCAPTWVQPSARWAGPGCTRPTARRRPSTPTASSWRSARWCCGPS